MNKPKMFSTPFKKQEAFPVYVISCKKTARKYKSEFIPNHYTARRSADFMLDSLGLQKTHTVTELIYNPNEGTYERS